MCTVEGKINGQVNVPIQPDQELVIYTGTATHTTQGRSEHWTIEVADIDPQKFNAAAATVAVGNAVWYSQGARVSLGDVTTSIKSGKIAIDLDVYMADGDSQVNLLEFQLTLLKKT